LQFARRLFFADRDLSGHEAWWKRCRSFIVAAF